jgi:hypothetical protein
MQTTEAIYNVTLDDGIMRNTLSPMIEQHLYGYLMCRPLKDFTANEVLAHLEKRASAAVYFESPFSLRTRVEIRRAEKMSVAD